MHHDHLEPNTSEFEDVSDLNFVALKRVIQTLAYLNVVGVRVVDILDYEPSLLSRVYFLLAEFLYDVLVVDPVVGCIG